MIKAWTTGPFTGKHFAAVMVAFFAVVIAVNVFMAREAIHTFGGEVVENSYVASQNFNTWLDEAAKEKALGWTASARHLPDGKVEVSLAGAPAEGVILKVEARHPLGRLPDQDLAFVRQHDGSFVSTAALPMARWKLRIEAKAGDKRWRTEQDFR